MSETTIARHGFQRVADGMSKVQDAPRAVIFTIDVLVLVAGDNRSFESALRFDDRFELSKPQCAVLFLPPSQKRHGVLEQLARSDSAILHRFTPTGGQLASRQGSE